MAVLAVLISERGRNCLGMTLFLLNLTCSMLGLAMVLTGIVLAVLFHQQQDMLNDFNYASLTNLIIVSGVCLVLFHLLGAKICFDCGNFKTRDRFRSLLTVYVLLLVAAFVLVVTVSVSATSSSNSLRTGFERGFVHLMASYDVDRKKRKQIDWMQTYNKCCGSAGFRDWTEIPWFPETYIRPDLQHLKARGVPFTCCDPSYLGPCLHDVGGEYERPGYRADEGKSFYQVGCSEVMTDTLKWFLDKLSWWLLLPAFLELSAAFLTTYLKTSIDSAAASADKKADAFGYLMESCPFSCLGFCESDVRSYK